MISRELLYSLSDDEKAILIFIFNEKYGEERYTLDCLTGLRVEALKNGLVKYAGRIEGEHRGLYCDLCKKFNINLTFN
jgi:hypothetical protein